MHDTLRDRIRDELQALRIQGLYKQERVIESPQGPEVRVGGRPILNFCANNYLGLAADPRVVAAAHAALDRWGYGLSSVRFICGTTALHRELERSLADFLGVEETILYAACFDANGGVFEPLVSPESVIISDRLNHASIIDGVRLARCGRAVYDHSDMAQLEQALVEHADADQRFIVTDGVFSMDGDYARLDAICDLADAHQAVVLVDDSHATGCVGDTGRGTPELLGVTGRVDLITTTLGKALGGALGGCTGGPRDLVNWLRQKSRPYLFSNSLPPLVCGAVLEVLEILRREPELLRRLQRNQARLRTGLAALGYDVGPGSHPIVPVHFRGREDDALLAQSMAAELLELGIYCIGFSFPVVPRGQARIRLQVSAAHEDAHIDRCLAAFAEAGRRLGAIPPARDPA